MRLIEQGEAEGGGIQLGILHAAAAAADAAAGQEALQDRDPPPGNMLHHLLEQRPRSRRQRGRGLSGLLLLVSLIFMPQKAGILSNTRK